MQRLGMVLLAMVFASPGVAIVAFGVVPSGPLGARAVFLVLALPFLGGAMKICWNAICFRRYPAERRDALRRGDRERGGAVAGRRDK